MKICIDPGHYGDNYNPGVAAGYVESNFTWTYAWLLKERLEKYGVEVVMTRTTKAEDLGLQARGKKAAGKRTCGGMAEPDLSGRRTSSG